MSTSGPPRITVGVFQGGRDKNTFTCGDNKSSTFFQDKHRIAIVDLDYNDECTNVSIAINMNAAANFTFDVAVNFSDMLCNEFIIRPQSEYSCHMYLNRGLCQSLCHCHACPEVYYRGGGIGGSRYSIIMIDGMATLMYIHIVYIV